MIQLCQKSPIHSTNGSLITSTKAKLNTVFKLPLVQYYCTGQRIGGQR